VTPIEKMTALLADAQRDLSPEDYQGVLDYCHERWPEATKLALGDKLSLDEWKKYLTPYLLNAR
jgi:hypothetical protein